MAANSIRHIENELRLNTTRGPLFKRCSQCGKPYSRRNATEIWTTRNEGHRYGWHKDIARVCLKCMTVSESEKIIGIADVQFSKMEKPPKKH